ncbi:MAG TPA: outer membrane beta-barrel protein [Vicinamibacterales bacterium]|nr:outer membrane beta-barrel protein [Vicinamibacterales bacterium]
MNLRSRLAAMSALMLFTAAAPARADVVLTPYVGSLFGGDVQNNRTAYGGSAAFMGGGVFGAEIGFNYTPTFVPETFASPKVSQASLMGNLILGIPMGGDSGHSVRPYITGGAGLFRATSRESEFFNRITSNDFAVNVGGGVMAFFSNHVGVRGDLRYFRTLTNERAGNGFDFDLGEMNFWKWDVGAAFRF